MNVLKLPSSRDHRVFIRAEFGCFTWRPFVFRYLVTSSLEPLLDRVSGQAYSLGYL